MLAAAIIGALVSVVGVAVVSQVVARGIFVVAISALIGGVAISILELVTVEKGNRKAGDIGGRAISGIGCGAINGVILAIILAIVRLMGWGE